MIGWDGLLVVPALVCYVSLFARTAFLPSVCICEESWQGRWHCGVSRAKWPWLSSIVILGELRPPAVQ